jgi:iron-sulfur cluster assembly protein
MNVTVTEKAIGEIKRIIVEQELKHDKVALRVRVLGGGCSGFTTKLDLDEAWSEEKDNVFTTDGVRVVVDKRSALYLEGASVDFHEDLNKRGFVVNNPSAVSKCGCGSSFSM